MKEFVVEFKLPFDRIEVRHGTNVAAPNAVAAKSRFLQFFPSASVLAVSEGCCMLYGAPFCTWDSSLGASCSPSSPLLRVRRSLACACG